MLSFVHRAFSPRNTGPRTNWFPNVRQQGVFYAAFVLTWSLNEWVRTPSPGYSKVAQPANVEPVLVESIKLVVSAGFFLWQRKLSYWFAFLRKPSNEQRAREEALPLHGYNEDNGGESVAADAARWQRSEKRWETTRVPPTIVVALTVLAAILFTYHGHVVPLVERVTGSLTLCLASSLAIIFIMLMARIMSSTIFTITQWQSALMQFAGLWIIYTSIMKIPLTLPHTLYPLLIGLVSSTTVTFTLIEFIYRIAHSISLGGLHILFFTVTCLCSYASNNGSSTLLLSSPTLSREAFLPSIFQAAVDLLTLTAIYSEGAASTGILTAYSAAAYILAYSVLHHVRTIGLLLGASISLLGSTIYLYGRQEEQSSKPRSWFSRILAILLLCGLNGYFALNTHRAVADTSLSLPERAPALLDALAPNDTCHRKPLLSLSYYPYKRTYHAFDNVLLIVFFSHARYDVNLDYYQEVYSEFFPNIVFIGPGNREDLGFLHSYDVMVDTYEADEDLSDPSFYKMAGRMAHHMLYTAMREHDCYDGYLWAPFDTLLNVPRLQQFDQNRFWYHSPFGQYVPNPALGDAAANQDKTRHAPPANISPDPSVNLTATWRHWGPDWWWGEPHVGVHVCMRAFERVAPEMRAHLATLTNGTRFIGGSADTVYIPGQHRKTFLEVLGLFLETDCFLEIATPTAVHLVSPPGEPIQYVDHWWIWQPPFNADFVRQQWAAGYEVDTFHTFHWGEKDDDGVWSGEPRHIQDVRMLLHESAMRQGIEWSSQALF